MHVPPAGKQSANMIVIIIPKGQPLVREKSFQIDSDGRLYTTILRKTQEQSHYTAVHYDAVLNTDRLDYENITRN